MTKYLDIIHLKSELKSFQWNDGLFILVKETEDTFEMCKLDDLGEPQLFDDGRPESIRGFLILL